MEAICCFKYLCFSNSSSSETNRSKSTRETLLSIIIFFPSGRWMSTSVCKRLPSGLLWLSCKVYSRSRSRPDFSRIRVKISSPQFPCILLSPFSALVRLSASLLICWLSCTSVFNCSRISLWRPKLSLLVSSTRFSNVFIFSCNGFSRVSRLSLFCSLNLVDFSSRILLARFSNSLVNFSCSFSTSAFCSRFFSSRLSNCSFRRMSSAFK